MNNLEKLKKAYISYQLRLVRYAQRYLPEQEANDVVQEAFLAYFDSYPDVSDLEETRRLLTSIVHNLCVKQLQQQLQSKDYITKARARLSLEDLQREPDGDGEGPPLLSIERLNELLLALPPRQQEIIRLRYLDGLRCREIAARLQLSRRTVENTLYRAITALRKKLTDNGQEQ